MRKTNIFWIVKRTFHINWEMEQQLQIQSLSLAKDSPKMVTLELLEI